MLVNKYEDDYFIITRKHKRNLNNIMIYLCDQLSGLKECIKYLKENF
jgi:hypothetical protein